MVMKIWYVVGSPIAGHNKTKTSQKLCRHKKASNHVKVLLECLWYEGLHKWKKKPIIALRIWKLNSNSRKLEISDINWSNPCGNQATHFTNYIESLNAPNSSYDHQNANSTCEAKWTMCISFINKRKTQMRWAVATRQKLQKWINAITFLPKDPLVMYHIWMKWLWNPHV
jgi:hypothetical protein